MVKNSLSRKALETLRTLFSSAVLDFSQFEDEEGKTYQYSVLEVGAEVFVATSEGSEPAPNGEYKVDESLSIKVEDGLITEVIEEKVEEVDEVEEVEVEVSPMEEYQSELSARLKASGKFSDEEIAELLEYKEELEDLVEEVAESDEEEELLNEVVSGVTELIKEAKESKEEIDELKAEVEALKEGFAKFVSEPVKKEKTKFSKIGETSSELNNKILQDVFSKISK